MPRRGFLMYIKNGSCGPISLVKICFLKAEKLLPSWLSAVCCRRHILFSPFSPPVRIFASIDKHKAQSQIDNCQNVYDLPIHAPSLYGKFYHIRRGHVNLRHIRLLPASLIRTSIVLVRMVCAVWPVSRPSGPKGYLLGDLGLNIRDMI